MHEHSTSDVSLESALPALMFLPVAVGASYGPVVWVDSGHRPDLDELTERLAIIEKHITRLSEPELQRVMGEPRRAGSTPTADRPPPSSSRSACRQDHSHAQTSPCRPIRASLS